MRRGAEAVRWIHGDATTLPLLSVDLATMTANVVQAVVEAEDWAGARAGIRAALRPGGHVVFETRVPTARAWTRWNRAASETSIEIAGVGPVRSWVELLDVALPLVTFRWTYVFAADGAVLTSDSTLRFRDRAEAERDLAAAGFRLEEVRDAADRPGEEFVFVARRPQ